MVTMTIALDEGTDPAAAKAAIRQRLQQSYGIGHVTIELDV